MSDQAGFVGTARIRSCSGVRRHFALSRTPGVHSDLANISNMTITSFSLHYLGLDSAPKGALACFTAEFFETVNGCPAWVKVAFAKRPMARHVFSAMELFDTVIRQPHRTPFTIIPSVSACSQLRCRLTEKDPEMTGKSRISLLI